ncbi:hypothetical protein J6590_053032 [Homalodisca vitripennis]|nr:hypothetical protein J6590_053032 [Homalodisca vitripennis]
MWQYDTRLKTTHFADWQTIDMAWSCSRTPWQRLAYHQGVRVPQFGNPWARLRATQLRLKWDELSRASYLNEKCYQLPLSARKDVWRES